MERVSIWDRLAKANQAGRPLTQKQLEELIGGALADQYVYLESTLAAYSIETGSMVRIIEHPGDRQHLAAVRATFEQTTERVANAAWDTEDSTFMITDPNKRIALKITALSAARRFWADKFQEPDKSYDISTLGARRIAAIEGKLQQLQPPEGPSV